MNPLLLLKILSQIGKSVGAFTSRQLSATPDLVQQINEFKARPEIRNVLSILDFENYRPFEMTFPSTGRSDFVRVDDPCLERSLRSYDEMMALSQGLEALQAGKGETIQATDERLETYLLEFEKEIILRDWFNRFLEGLEGLNQLIESRQATVEGLRPFIIDWIEVIADRSKRRIGGTSFYDQLFKFIVESGYGGVIELFERYGYRITPPPYDKEKDFSSDLLNTLSAAHAAAAAAATQQPDLTPNLGIALSLAKAAYLSYEDQDYVKGITRRCWIPDQGLDRTRYSQVQLTERALHEFYVAEEDRLKSATQINTATDEEIDCIFFENPETSTEGFAFVPNREGQKKTMVLSLRGTQEFLQDWGTNVKLKLEALHHEPEAKSNKAIRVHRGFQAAWRSVREGVLDFVDKNKPDQILITGHSLGGALATLATVALKEKQHTIAGLYTFGQPPVGDQNFVKYFNDELKIPAYRFVNNNDVVPRSLNAVRSYRHIGKMQYFTTDGDLLQNVKSAPRLDRWKGYLKATFEPGVEGVYDHRMEFYIARIERAYLKRVQETREKSTS